MVNNISLQQKFTVNSYINRNLAISYGDGVYLYDSEGNRYLDLFSNYGGSIFGHNNEEINAVINGQARKLILLHNSFSNDVRARVSMQLIKRCGGSYSKVHWSNSGAEAVEAALKFVRLASGKSKIIACKGSYHGKTLGALSATYDKKYRKYYEPLLWDFDFIDYNNIEALDRAIDSNVGAFILEPLQGESGIIVPSDNYLKAVQELCNKKGVLLVLDEIQTGCGRTGTFLYSQKFSVQADIVCIGKGLAAGLPVGATVVSDSIAEKLKDSAHTSTFGGNLLVCAVTGKVLEMLDTNLLRDVVKLGESFTSHLKNVKSDVVYDVRGVGLMLGIEVKETLRNEILRELQNNKVLAIPAGGNVIRFLPPYIIEDQHIDTAVSSLKRILQDADN